MPRVRPIKIKKDQGLLHKAAKVVAKHAKVKDLKGEIPDEMIDVVKHKQRKKAYDHIHKETSSPQVTQWRKLEMREKYKETRKKSLQKKDWQVYTDAHISNKEK